MSANAVMGHTWSKGKKSVAFGTAIVILVQPYRGKKTKLTKAVVTAAGTAHTLTVMRPLNSTTTTAAALASQAVAVLAADPGTYTAKRTANNGIAANDYLVFETPDGSFYYDTVSSWVSGTLSVTMTSSFPTGGIASGAKVWFFGVTTDTNPVDADTHPAFNVPASATTTFADDAGVVTSLGNYEPLLVVDSNATATGTIEYLAGAYGP